MTALETLRSLRACGPALAWAARQSDQRPQALWDACDRGDRLAWYLGALGVRDGYGSPAHRRAVLVACLCARTVSAHWRDPACERAVSLAETWAWGDETITREQLYAAADAAADADAAFADAADAAAAAAAAFADAAFADAAADAAYAAAFADAAADAAYASDADADAAADAAFRVAREAHLAALADLIRAAIPEVPL